MDSVLLEIYHSGFFHFADGILALSLTYLGKRGGFIKTMNII
jgi:hypothetical protein